MAGKFTFPTKDQIFIVADQVNVTWTVNAPRISLYETCGNIDYPLEGQTSNKYSYIWTATRDNYVERGCSFMIQPFTADGEAYGNNISSTDFGVSKRYTDDPSPTSYNFQAGSSFTTASGGATTSTSTSMSLTSTSLTSTTSSETTSTPSPTTTSTPQHSKGLSTPAKIGIGLGVPLGVLILAVAIGMFFWFRRKSRQREPKVTPASNHHRDELSPLPTIEPKLKQYQRVSKTETVDSHSQCSREYPGSTGTGRPLSELMSTERAEME